MSARRRIQRFEVLDRLGSGGIGHVYRARDPELERDVAIKMLAMSAAPGELSAHDTLDLRSDAPASHDDLLREARMMARLSHPNVLPVYEVGLCDGAVFLVMEHIDGTDLSVWLESPRTTRAILDVFLQAARGLAAAHDHGIVHRDVKPHNILIGRDGRVRVADFGLSRLAGRPATAMMYFDDGRGTPRYMAPEQWRGEPATPRSDVFALCLALLEAFGGDQPETRDRALRERGVGQRLRQLLDRGLADDPAARPELAALIAALDDRPPRWRTWAIASSAVAAAIAIAVGSSSPPPSSLARNSAPACDPDPAAFAARWNAGRRDAVARVLVEQAQPGFRGVAEQIADEMVKEQQAMDESLAGACKAARAGEITWDEYRIRASCLQRRAFEHDATADLMLETKPNLLDASYSFDSALLISFCSGAIAAPIAGDGAASEALWRRYIHSDIYAVPARAAEHIAELTAIAAAAAEIGETELVARSLRWIAIEQKFLGSLELADETLQRAYRMALELKATTLATRVLLVRSDVAASRDDATAERSFAELAKDMGDTPTAPPSLRAAVYQALAQASSAQGNHAAAIQHLRHALDIVKTSGIATNAFELELRGNLLSALTRRDVQEPGTIELALETAERTRGLVGDHHKDYGSAVFMVANTYAAVQDYTHAISHRRKAIEILSASLPANHVSLPKVLSFLALDLYGAGDLEAAQHVVDRITQLTANDPRYFQNQWLDQGFFATLAFERGKLDAGLARGIEAHEEAISKYGKQHPDTLGVRWNVAAMELELRRLDDAARDIAALEAGYRAKPEDNQLRLLRLQGTLAAELAIARGKPRDAEDAARHTIDAAAELHATDRDRAGFHKSLGASLVEQHRWAEAHTALETALALLTSVHARPDDIAAVEIKLAVAEAGLGRRGPALARARRARTVLDDYPGQLRARSEADELLGGPRKR